MSCDVTGIRQFERLNEARLRVRMLPALRDGAPAVPVSLVAAAAILYAVIYIGSRERVNGRREKSRHHS